MNGVVKKHMSDKGFGFIRAEDGKEYFFHNSACAGKFDKLVEGTEVTFEVETSPKGPRAESVRRA